MRVNRWILSKTMSEAGTKQAFHNVYKANKVFTNSLEKRIDARITALEKKVSELRTLYERKLCELQVAQRKQLDAITRNEKRIEKIMGRQQEQIMLLTDQNNAVVESQRQICDFISSVIQRRMMEIEESVGRMLAIESE